MKGDKIKIIDIKKDEYNILCVFPNIGEPIPLGLVDGYLIIPCYIEYYENGDKFYRVIEEETVKEIVKFDEKFLLMDDVMIGIKD